MKEFKIIIYISFLFTLLSCGQEEEKPLVSNIDGREFLEIMQGEMTPQKITLLLLNGYLDSVNYEHKLDLLEGLEANDAKWRKKYLKALNIILKDYNRNDYILVEQAVFSFFIHYPQELMDFINTEGSDKIDLWTELLSNALKQTVEPEDITTTSVINLTIRNCENCPQEEKELIEHFVKSLEQYSKL